MDNVEVTYAVDCMDMTYANWQWVVRESINGQVHAPVCRCENRETALIFKDALSAWSKNKANESKHNEGSKNVITIDRKAAEKLGVADLLDESSPS